MAEHSGISWCDATFNPWIGCEKVSPGCAHCYAETLVVGRMGRENAWGADGVRQRTSAANWRKPLRWNALAREGRLPDGSPNLDGHRPRVFCASLADVFEPRPELAPWREDLLGLIKDTAWLDWLLLTKRPDEMRDRFFAGGWTLTANLWLGTSVENSRHTWRADALRAIPAAVRFISAEPLLGSLYHSPNGLLPKIEYTADDATHRRLDLHGIDWVIVGGESGGRTARPMNPEWAREIRNACVTGSPFPPPYMGAGIMADGGANLLNIPFHFKQWGSHDAHGVYRGASPKSSGKLLDGIEWCEFPAALVPA